MSEEDEDITWLSAEETNEKVAMLVAAHRLQTCRADRAVAREHLSAATQTGSMMRMILQRAVEELLAMGGADGVHEHDIRASTYCGPDGQALRRVVAIGHELVLGGPGIALMTFAVEAVRDRGRQGDHVELMMAWEGISDFMNMHQDDPNMA